MILRITLTMAPPLRRFPPIDGETRQTLRRLVSEAGHAAKGSSEADCPKCGAATDCGPTLGCPTCDARSSDRRRRSPTHPTGRQSG